MSRNLNRPTVRLRWLPTTLWILATTLVVAPTFGTTKIICGKPTKTGTINVIICMMNGDGHKVCRPVPVTVPATATAQQKADSVRAVVNRKVGNDTLTATGTTSTVTFEGHNSWRVDVIAAGPDGTEEPDEFALGIPPNQQEGLCSLAGVATGLNVSGGPAFVRIKVGQAIVMTPTQQGMTADIVEQLLIARLNQAGVQARFATAADFQGYEDLQHDPRVIWFPIPDSTGCGEEITDVGLGLDLAGVLNGSPATTSAPDAAPTLGLTLDVSPNPFSHAGVSVHYSARAEAGRLRLEVFEVMGRMVCTLLEGAPPATGALPWDGKDDRNALVPGGVYFMRLSTLQGDIVRRVVLVRD
jgi:hypothetical protein